MIKKKKKEIKKTDRDSYRESDEGGGEKTILSFVEASGQDILLKLISILNKWFPREDPNKWMPKDISQKKKKNISMEIQTLRFPLDDSWIYLSDPSEN